jgi:hypothetical protein
MEVIGSIRSMEEVEEEVQGQPVSSFLSELGALGTPFALGSVPNASPRLLLMILKATLKTSTLNLKMGMILKRVTMMTRMKMKIGMLMSSLLKLRLKNTWGHKE